MQSVRALDATYRCLLYLCALQLQTQNKPHITTHNLKYVYWVAYVNQHNMSISKCIFCTARKQNVSRSTACNNVQLPTN